MYRSIEKITSLHKFRYGLVVVGNTTQVCCQIFSSYTSVYETAASTYCKVRKRAEDVKILDIYLLLLIYLPKYKYLEYQISYR